MRNQGAMWMAVLLGLGAPAAAWACEKHAQAKDQPKAEAAKQPKAKARSGLDASSSILGPVDELVAQKCSCKGPSDCTCKKGKCECPKCKKRHPAKPQIIETMNGRRDALKLPGDARRDATAGVFI